MEDPVATWPGAVLQVLRRLHEAGFSAALVGGCVRDWIQGREIHDFDVVTAAPPEATLALFPRAVPIGVRHGTVMVPSAAGPVDVTTLRAGPRLEDDLAHRDFTVNAIACDPLREVWLDPFSGRSDLAAGRLRAVGRAADRFAEDPLRALRAARLVATQGFAADPEIAGAMPATAVPLRAVAAERVRSELQRMLLGPAVDRGLALLREGGLEAELAPGAAADAPALLTRLPRDLDLRLAAWLRGTSTHAILKRLRFSRVRGQHVERLLRLHPLEAGVRPESDASVRRMLRRAGDDLDALLALRGAELAQGADPAAREAWETLLGAIERVRRAGKVALRRRDLALDGREVVRRLGCRPGPVVGEALAYLADRVVEDPGCNTPERLAELLQGWWERRGRA